MFEALSSPRETIDRSSAGAGTDLRSRSSVGNLRLPRCAQCPAGSRRGGGASVPWPPGRRRRRPRGLLREHSAVWATATAVSEATTKVRKRVERWLVYHRRLHTHEREHQESTLVILPRHCCSEPEAEEVRVVQYR